MDKKEGSEQMGRVYEFKAPLPLEETLVEDFVKKLVDQKRLNLIERGRTSDRIEITLDSFFHFLAQKGVCHPGNGEEAKKYEPALSVFNWLGPARQVLTSEWHHKPPPGVKMITRRAITFLEEKGFVFRRAGEKATSCEAQVIPLTKRPR